MGARVACLDVVGEGEDGEGGDEEGDVKFYRCDVGDLESVTRVAERIHGDLGVPTVLINNAAIVNGQPLLSLSPEAIERNFRVNLLSHFHTIRTFLPDMLSRPEGGTIVTVSSVLGHLGPARLSDYAAAKAGLTAVHASLRAEIDALAVSASNAHRGAKNTRMILVKPGQLSTQMFDSIDTPSSFFGPVVQGVDLAGAVIEAIESGRDGVISMPLYARYIEWMGILPYGLQRVARWMSGVDRAMTGFSAPKQEITR
ncbi:hypothetical protein AAFC00_006789 [Neodothiora populina]